MWAIIKIDQNLSNLFKQDFKKNIGSELITYSPKYLVQYFKKNKLKFKEITLLNNYIFCFNSNFENPNFMNRIKYFKGFKSCISGHLETQKEIVQFISKCKDSENNSGYIQNSFFNISDENNYKLKTGVFNNKVFELIKFQKNRIQMMIGNLKVSTKRKDFLAQPV